MSKRNSQIRKKNCLNSKNYILVFINNKKKFILLLNVNVTIGHFKFYVDKRFHFFRFFYYTKTHKLICM